MTALKNVLGCLLAAGVLVASPAAFADGHGNDGHGNDGHGDGRGNDGPGDRGKKPAAAPELAGKGAPAALALIAAGAAIVVSRRRRQD
jgi:uncharacterized protein (TIGR03382 family)